MVFEGYCLQESVFGVFFGNDGICGYQLEFRVFGKKSGDLFFVFVGIHRACGINQKTFRSYEICCVFQRFFLQFDQLRDVVVRLPTQIRLAGKYSPPEHGASTKTL